MNRQACAAKHGLRFFSRGKNITYNGPRIRKENELWLTIRWEPRLRTILKGTS